MHGLALAPDGRKVYVSLQSYIVPGDISKHGKILWEKRIPIPGAGAKRGRADPLDGHEAEEPPPRGADDAGEGEVEEPSEVGPLGRRQEENREPDADRAHHEVEPVGGERVGAPETLADEDGRDRGEDGGTEGEDVDELWQGGPLATPRGGTARVRRHDCHLWRACARRHAAPEGVSVDFDLPDESPAGAGASSPVAWT